MNNRKIIHSLSDNLNRIKGFYAGYTTSNSTEMLISFEDKTYKLNIQEVEESELTLDLVKKYL